MPSPMKTKCRICNIEGMEGEIMKWGKSLCKKCYNPKLHCKICGTSLDVDEYGTCRYCDRGENEAI